jgi:hypothetical protein
MPKFLVEFEMTAVLQIFWQCHSNHFGQTKEIIKNELGGGQMLNSHSIKSHNLQNMAAPTRVR